MLQPRAEMLLTFFPDNSSTYLQKGSFHQQILLPLVLLPTLYINVYDIIVCSPEDGSNSSRKYLGKIWRLHSHQKSNNSYVNGSIIKLAEAKCLSYLIIYTYTYIYIYICVCVRARVRTYIRIYIYIYIYIYAFYSSFVILATVLNILSLLLEIFIINNQL